MRPPRIIEIMYCRIKITDLLIVKDYKAIQKMYLKMKPYIKA